MENFDDYKDALKSKYRIKANKADSKSQALEGRFMSKNDIESAQKALQNLYQNTIDNANFNAQVLNLKTYNELKSFYKDGWATISGVGSFTVFLLSYVVLGTVCYRTSSKANGK